jgi:hypothetical protein
MENKILLTQIVDQYEEQERLSEISREEKRRQIKELENQLLSPPNIYNLVYKPEHGDYREFVQAVAAELRTRNKNKK